MLAELSTRVNLDSELDVRFDGKLITFMRPETDARQTVTALSLEQAIAYAKAVIEFAVATGPHTAEEAAAVAQWQAEQMRHDLPPDEHFERLALLWEEKQDALSMVAAW